MASGSGTGPSFKTNVNRMKTKRWVEAKSYSYDGDDWGDADEYDEYDGYDEPPAAPVPGPAPSGSRQTSAGYAQDPRQQMPPFPGAPPQSAYMQQQQQQIRAGSPGRPPYAQDSRDRSGSFNRGDERRNFSGPAAPGSPSVAPMRTAYGSAPRNQSPAGRVQQRTATAPVYGQSGFAGSRTNINPQMGDPSATLPPPGAPFAAGHESGGRTWSMGSSGSGSNSVAFAQRREYSPSSANRATQQQPVPAARPPRKSSLSLATEPVSTQALAESEANMRSAAGPAAMGPESPTPRIIRPADIYKRVAEEKERERMSQESGRPSMSEIMRDGPVDATGFQSTESPGPGLRPRKHTLDTVAERKSEYGSEGMLDHKPASELAQKAFPVGLSEEQRKRFSTSPQLPSFESGFGDDWISGFGSDGEKRATTSAVQQQAQAQAQPVGREADVAAGHAGLGLSHKPSEGFRSVVHQAFDEPIGADTPAGSVGRSDTTSTNAISPIISRNPSKEQDAKNKAMELRAINMGAIAEEGNIGAPHEAGSSITLRQIDGKAQPSNDLPPPGFIPGHRRNSSVPSPGNSPARQPKLEVRNVAQDEEGEFGAATPIEERETRRRAESAAKASQIQSVVESLSQKAREDSGPQSSPTRAESPTKGRVRDLVDKVESVDNSRRNSASSLNAGLRPSQDRSDSFRPQLPGGWNSYVTNATSASPERGVSPRPASRPDTSGGNQPSSLAGPAVNPTLLGLGGTSTQTSPNPNTATSSMDIEPTTRKRSLVEGEATDSIDPTQEPLAAAKAAGAALAGAFGLGGSNDDEPAPGPYGAARGPHQAYEKGGITVYPDSTRPLMPPSQDSAATSILTTTRGYSPPRMSEEVSEEEIPAVAPLRQRVPGAPVSPTVGAAAPILAGIPTLQRPMSEESVPRGSPLDENDRLREDIVRQLSPNTAVDEASGSQPVTSKPAAQTYISYQPLPQQNPVADGPALLPASQKLGSTGPVLQSAPRQQRKSKNKTLKHKFSWEVVSESSDDEAPATVHTSPAQTAPQSYGSTAPTSGGSIIAPTQTITTVQSEPISELDSAPTFQQGFMGPVMSRDEDQDVSKQELTLLRTSTEEPVTRQVSEFSGETTPIADRLEFDDALKSPPPPQVPAKNDYPSPSPDSQEVEQQQFQPPSQGARQRGQTISNQVQVPAFREILAMKSPEERLRVYRSTQDTFANMNTGLTNWIQAMGEKHPEHRPLLQTTGNFSAPTPGLPQVPRAAAGSSPASGSGSGFSGLRKAGAAAAPSMGEAGAALKSAGRDTKKLAKGLFAKGRSKFGRDKGSSKLAAVSSPAQKYQPPRPGANVAPPQQYVAYRPGQQPGVQDAFTSTALNLAQVNTTAIAASSQSIPPRHTANQKSLPAIPAESPALDVASRPSDVSDLSGSFDEERMGEIPILLSPMPEPPVKPVLQQRLTIHQKDITPFEVSFPSALLGSEAYKEQKSSDEAGITVPRISDREKPGTPREEEEIPDQLTPRQTRFPKRTQSLSAGRTLDPGVEAFNTTPSWLNFDPANSPANSDLFSLTSPRKEPSKSSPTAVRSKRASLQIQFPSTESRDQYTEQAPIEEESDEDQAPTAGTEDRPFSFINFAARPEMDFSLDEAAYRMPSRQSSVLTESTEDYEPSHPSTYDNSIRPEVSRDNTTIDEDIKALPPIPDEPSSAQHNIPGQFATMPARSMPKVSLFPQSTSRPGTRERELDDVHSDFSGPLRVQTQPQDYSATMPADPGKPQKHRRNFSGANLLQRALTAGISVVENPLRDKNVVKAEKTDKKRRRLSGFNLLGKPKNANRRVPIDDPTPPGTSRVLDGGMSALATTAQTFEQQLPVQQTMQRSNVPDPIHVAPIEGYYSPEGDATQPPMTSPIPSTHIASQYNDGSMRSPPRNAASSAAASPAHRSPTTFFHPRPVQQQAPSPQVASTSAFNESNSIVSNSMRKSPSQAQTSQYPAGPGYAQTPTQSSNLQQPRVYAQPMPQSQPKSSVYEANLSPLNNPATSHLPQPLAPLPASVKSQIPYPSTTLERTVTLRPLPNSLAQPIDPSQLNIDLVDPALVAAATPGTPGSSPSPSHPSSPHLDRRSLDAFPRPPSKASNNSSSSPNAQHSAPGLHSHSPSASVSTPRKTRGPGLSVNTNLANSSPAAERARRIRTASKEREAARTGSNPSDMFVTQNRSPHQGQARKQGQNISPALGPRSTQPQGNAAAQSQAQAPSGGVGLGVSFPTAASDQKSREGNKRLLENSRGGRAVSDTGFGKSGNVDDKDGDVNAEIASIIADPARNVTIQPAALRRMRQREIELGGETRLNSPMGPGQETEAMPVLRVDGLDEAVGRSPESATTPRATQRGGEGLIVAETSEREKMGGEGKEAEKAEGVGQGADAGEEHHQVKANESDGGEDKIVMSATSFPGQEWNPYEQWA